MDNMDKKVKAEDPSIVRWAKQELFDQATGAVRYVSMLKTLIIWSTIAMVVYSCSTSSVDVAVGERDKDGNYKLFDVKKEAVLREKVNTIIVHGNLSGIKGGTYMRDLGSFIVYDFQIGGTILQDEEENIKWLVNFGIKF